MYAANVAHFERELAIAVENWRKAKQAVAA